MCSSDLFSKIPLHYPRISKHAPLLSVPLGKPPTFDGEDYARWSDLTRFHLTSLHKSIWDVVEFGAQVPSVGDKDYDEDEVAQIEHFNSQATTILLASLVISPLGLPISLRMVGRTKIQLCIQALMQLLPKPRSKL